MQVIINADLIENEIRKGEARAALMAINKLNSKK